MSSDTKTALLDSAERAARTRGFDGFSYADLADDVGIRKASIHHHFPTKAALSAALMVRYHQDLKASLEAIETEYATGGQRLAALVGRYRVALDGGQSLCLCVSFSASRESLPQEVIAQISAFRKMMNDWIAAQFDLAGLDGSVPNTQNPKDEAAGLLALLEGGQLAARAEENAALFDAALHTMVTRFG